MNEVWKYDKYVIDGMKKQGYNVHVVWESELKNELEKTTEKILKFVYSWKFLILSLIFNSNFAKSIRKAGSHDVDRGNLQQEIVPLT